jgi:hypothetical protein
MDKLRHILSKVGTETAFRIPVSVEDAIAEAVEAYDEMAAKVERLESSLKFTIKHAEWALQGQMFNPQMQKARDVLSEPLAASPLLHDAQLIRDVADKLTFHNIDDCSYYKGYDHAILDVRAAADALEGEG